jgi:uncharacterized protein with HEPN domain
MTKIDDPTRLHHIIDAGKETMSLIQNLDRNSFEENRVLVLAVTRLVEIIGEASAKISSDTKTKYPQIPWQAMVGMRNRIVHAYFDIDLNILWQTITEDLPPLIAELEKILPEIEANH